MKKFLSFLIITFLFGIYGVSAQGGAHTQSFNGNLNGASISGSIKYKADCLLGNPYISVVIGNIKITSYTYKGIKYSRNDIPGYTFPVRVKRGHLFIKSSFRYGTNSKLQTASTNIDINSSVGGGLASAFLDDRFYWENEKRIIELLKGHGMKNCGDDWGQKLGGISRLSITDGGIGGVDRELDEAIEKLLKGNKVNALLKDANYQLSSSNYDSAEKLFRDVLREDSSNQEAKESLYEIRKIKNNKVLEEKFTTLIGYGDDYYSRKDFKKAKDEYKRALSTGFDNEKAQDKIWEAEAEIEEEDSKKLADAIKADKAEEKRIKDDEDELKKFQEKLAAKREKDAADAETRTKEAVDAGQVSRNLAKRRKEAEEEKKRKFEQSVNNLANGVGVLLGGFFESLSKGDKSYLRFAYGIRNLESGDNLIPGSKDGDGKHSSVDVNTIEAGFAFGRLGFFLGYGGPHSKLSYRNENSEQQATGSTWFAGLQYTILYNHKGFDFGLNIEGGKGSFKTEYLSISRNYKSFNKRPSTFYSVGAQATLFKYLYISYNYGFYEQESSVYYQDDFRPSYEGETVKGEFSKIAIGIKFSNWY
jgi:hypothetical protein